MKKNTKKHKKLNLEERIKIEINYCHNNRPVAHLPPTLVAPFFTLSFLIPHFQMKIPHTTRYLHDRDCKILCVNDILNRNHSHKHEQPKTNNALV